MPTASQFQPPGHTQAQRIDPKDPLASVLLFRMRSREPAFQMPPLGSRLADAEAVELVTQFLTEDLSQPPNPKTTEK